MARRLIIMFWAALLLGCSSLSNIKIVNHTGRTISVQSEYLPARNESARERKATGTLRHGESMTAVPGIFSPGGELVVTVDAKQKHRYQINGTSSGGEIWCEVGGGATAAPKTTGGLNSVVRGGLTAFLVVPLVAIAMSLIFRFWRSKSTKIALP